MSSKVHSRYACPASLSRHRFSYQNDPLWTKSIVSHVVNEPNMIMYSHSQVAVLWYNSCRFVSRLPHALDRVLNTIHEGLTISGSSSLHVHNARGSRSSCSPHSIQIYYGRPCKPIIISEREFVSRCFQNSGCHTLIIFPATLS